MAAGTLSAEPWREECWKLPEQPCDPGVRELIGSLLFLSRCTRFDISFFSLHDLPDLSHAGASGLERKSDTFSVFFLHTLLNGPSS